MVLAVDIGNSSIQIGVWEGAELLGNWRLSTREALTKDEAWLILREMLGSAGLPSAELKGVSISSVVPPLTRAFQEMAEERFAVKPLVVSPKVETGMEILYHDPSQVGGDRIANSVAAFKKYGGPVVVVDFGTATTFDVVSKEGKYLGGVIAPGIRMGAEALCRRTAKLPEVELTSPESTIGRNTEEAIRAGILLGAVGQIREILGGIREELGEELVVTATGGELSLIREHLQMIQHMDENLTLEGLRIIWELNREVASKG